MGCVVERAEVGVEESRVVVEVGDVVVVRVVDEEEADENVVVKLLVPVLLVAVLVEEEEVPVVLATVKSNSHNRKCMPVARFQVRMSKCRIFSNRDDLRFKPPKLAPNFGPNTFQNFQAFSLSSDFWMSGHCAALLFRWHNFNGSESQKKTSLVSFRAGNFETSLLRGKEEKDIHKMLPLKNIFSKRVSHPFA